MRAIFSKTSLIWLSLASWLTLLNALAGLAFLRTIGPVTPPSVAVGDVAVQKQREDVFAEFPIVMDKLWRQPILLSYRTEDQSARGGAEYEPAEGVVRLAPWETESRIRVRILGTPWYRPDRSLTLRVLSVSPATLGRESAQGRIAGDPALKIGVADVNVVKMEDGPAEAVFVVSPQPPCADPLTIAYRTENGTAQDGVDYRRAEGQLTFGPGEAGKPVRVALVGKVREEGQRKFRLVLNDPSCPVADLPRPTATIDYRIPDVRASIGTVTANVENELTDQVAVPVQLDQASRKRVVLAYRTEDGSAIAGTHYQRDEGRIVFAPGESVRPIAVKLLPGPLREASLSLFVCLTRIDGATLPRDRGEVILVYSGGSPLQMLVDPASVELEPGQVSRATFHVRLSRASKVPLVVNYCTAGDTAQGALDYEAIKGHVEFSPGTTEQPVEVKAKWREPLTARKFWLMAKFSGGRARSEVLGQGTIVSLPPPQPQVVVDSPRVQADRSEPTSVIFHVKPAAEAKLPLTVDFQTQDGTAKAGADYRETKGALTFASSKETQAVPVTVFPGDDDGQKTFALHLRSQGRSQGMLVRGTATIVVPPPPPPQLTVEGAAVAVGEGAEAVFHVRIRGAVRYPVKVDYQTVDGSAKAGSDYVAQKGQLAFTPRDSALAVRVPVKGVAAKEVRKFLLEARPANAPPEAMVKAEGVLLPNLGKGAVVLLLWTDECRDNKTLLDEMRRVQEKCGPRLLGGKLWISDASPAAPRPWTVGDPLPDDLQPTAAKQFEDCFDRGFATIRNLSKRAEERPPLFILVWTSSMNPDDYVEQRISMAEDLSKSMRVVWVRPRGVQSKRLAYWFGKGSIGPPDAQSLSQWIETLVPNKQESPLNE